MLCMGLFKNGPFEGSGFAPNLRMCPSLSSHMIHLSLIAIMCDNNASLWLEGRDVWVQRLVEVPQKHRLCPSRFLLYLSRCQPVKPHWEWDNFVSLYGRAKAWGCRKRTACFCWWNLPTTEIFIARRRGDWTWILQVISNEIPFRLVYHDWDRTVIAAIFIINVGHTGDVCYLNISIIVWSKKGLQQPFNRWKCLPNPVLLEPVLVELAESYQCLEGASYWEFGSFSRGTCASNLAEHLPFEGQPIWSMGQGVLTPRVPKARVKGHGYLGWREKREERKYVTAESGLNTKLEVPN